MKGRYRPQDLAESGINIRASRYPPNTDWHGLLSDCQSACGLECLISFGGRWALPAMCQVQIGERSAWSCRSVRHQLIPWAFPLGRFFARDRKRQGAGAVQKLRSVAPASWSAAVPFAFCSKPANRKRAIKKREDFHPRALSLSSFERLKAGTAAELPAASRGRMAGLSEHPLRVR